MKQKDINTSSMPVANNQLDMVIDGHKVKLNFASAADEKILDELKTLILHGASKSEMTYIAHLQCGINTEIIVAYWCTLTTK